VGALAPGAAVLGERPSTLQLLGWALVLGNVVLATAKPLRTRPAGIETPARDERWRAEALAPVLELREQLARVLIPRPPAPNPTSPSCAARSPRRCIALT
jgi:hypothetical protein